MLTTRHYLRLCYLSLALGTAVAQDGLKFGNPGCDVAMSDREFADRKFFQLCHSSELLEPLWVGYVLTKADLDGPAPRPSGFKQDKKLRKPGAVDRDYVGSGFARGHMAPAEDFSRSKTAIKSTFILSNVVPQRQGVNGGRWAQLELIVRNLARQAGRAYVFTGPIYEDDRVDVIGAHEVGVPTHTFKVILTIGPADEKKMYAVIMPNDEDVDQSVNAFVTTVRAVEQKTGFNFFSALPAAEQERLERARETFDESLTKRVVKTTPKKKPKPAKKA
jgi:endonuclease G